MSKEQLLKDKIVEAVPDIMELKFGCEILDKYGNKNRIASDGDMCPNGVMMYDDYYKIVVEATVADEQPDERIPIKKCKILGRPITLDDVLRALGKKSAGYYTFAIHNETIIISSGKFDNQTLDWNLSKPLSEQTDKTLNFLHTILCN